MHDLKIDQHLATGRDAVTSAFMTGSSSLFKAFDGVRTEVSTRLKERETTTTTITPPPIDRRASQSTIASTSTQPESLSSGASLPVSHISRLSPTPKAAPVSIQPPQIADVKAALGNIGSGIGSFFGSRVASFRGTGPPAAPSAGASVAVTPVPVKGLRPMSLSGTLGDRIPRTSIDPKTGIDRSL